MKSQVAFEMFQETMQSVHRLFHLPGKPKLHLYRGCQQLLLTYVLNVTDPGRSHSLNSQGAREVQREADLLIY